MSTLKVLHVINSLATGGAEKLIRDTVPLYSASGIQTDILTLNATEYPFTHELKALNCGKIYSIKNYSIYNPLHVFGIIPYLKQYNIVHVHLFPAQYWVALAKVLSLSKTKIIFTEHSTNNRRANNPLFKLADKLIYRLYSKIISISPQVRDMVLRQTNIEAGRVITITNGVNIKAIDKATALDRALIFCSADDTIIMHIAGFKQPKDQATLIKALTYLTGNIKIVFVGDGTLFNDAKKLTDQLNLSDKVIFLGMRTDVAALLKTADISVLSTKWEGFGLVAIESMAAGIPFIASDVPGLAEVVSGAGILFEAGNDAHLASEIQKLLTDQMYYQSVAQACSDRAKKYDITKMISKHIQLYEQLAQA